MVSHRQKPAIPWLLIVLFVIISASSILLGLFYYKSQKRRLLNDKNLELSAIADLKVRQIAQWRSERIADAILIGENKPFVRLLYDYLYSTNNEAIRSEIVPALKSVTRNIEYKNIILIDPQGRVREHYPGQDTVIGEYLKFCCP